MKLPCHSMPRKLFDALASGGGGQDAIYELVAAERSKHLILLRSMLDIARGASTEQSLRTRRGYDLLAAVERNDRAAAETVIRHPSVGAWALRAVRAYRGDSAMPGAEPGGLSAVAAAAAIRAGLPAEIEVAVTGGKVVLPSLGAASVNGATAVVRSGKGHAEVISPGRRVKVPADPHRDAPNWLGLRQVQIGSLKVVLDDLDPFRMPGAECLVPRLGAAEYAEWAAALRQAWPLLDRHHTAVANEISAMITVIVPFPESPKGQVSSTSPEAFGAIAMSRPPDPVTCAVTLAHEIQHLKLSALLDIVALTLPESGERYYAPWREDPRPLKGLLQGAYAYLGVSGFWLRQRRITGGAIRLRADTEFARWRAAVALVIETLRSSGRLTPTGMDFVEGMGRTLRHWQDEPVPAAAQALARRQAELHFARWKTDHGPVLA